MCSRSCRLGCFLGLVEIGHVERLHLLVAVHLRGIFLHAGHLAGGGVNRFQIGADHVAQIGDHPAGEVGESTRSGLNMVSGHLCTYGEYFGVEAGVELSEFLAHPSFQFLVLLGRYQFVLRPVFGSCAGR